MSLALLFDRKHDSWLGAVYASTSINRGRVRMCSIQTNPASLLVCQGETKVAARRERGERRQQGRHLRAKTY